MLSQHILSFKTKVITTSISPLNSLLKLMLDPPCLFDFPKNSDEVGFWGDVGTVVGRGGDGVMTM